MKYKTFLTNLFFASMALGTAASAYAAPDTPKFSTDDDEHWYYIIFSAGENALNDQGVKNSLVTRKVEKGRESEQWKLMGSPEGFTLQCKNGDYVDFSGEYLRSITAKENAATFRLVASETPGYEDSWEIEYPDKGDAWNRWNQWGGSGVGKRIGLYTPGDGVNAVRFYSDDEIPDVPVFSKINEFPVSPAATFSPEHRHTIWFTKPATAESVSDAWMEYGLPIGNGEFGAMTFGGVAQDRIQFNDKSLWTGSQNSHGSYQNFGDLYIEDFSGAFDTGNSISDYVRYLDMEEGVASARYTSPDGSVSYTRDYIASYPDKVVAIKLGASENGKISVRIRLFNGVKQGMLAPLYNGNTISMESKLEYVDFKAKVKVVPTGGTIRTEKDYIEVEGADELLVILAGATNFDQHSPTYLGSVDSMNAMVDSRVDNAAAKGWEAILADHTADHKALFGRVDFNIAGAAHDRNTQDMVTRYNTRRVQRTEACNLMLEELYYAYGRYLLIGSSRGMDTPANLQGIWNHSDNPAWQSDIHANINVQMNYWPAESTNLSELHAPFLNYIHSMVTEHPQWRQYAKDSGQTVGFTCYTQNNIFGYSDYAENYVIANAWYVSHLWQHYLYTLDRDFLIEKAFPLMTECCRYWMERLVEASDGSLVAPKEWSPEHGPGEEDGTAHAQQIIANLFASTLKAIEILGDDTDVEAGFKNTLSDKYAALDKGLATEEYNGWGTANGLSNGSLVLREWKYSDISAGEDQHRHQSHLMALYPFSDITPESEWFVPAVNSLTQRGDVSTGWSLAWRICLWARALDGEHAATIIKSALRHATSYSQTSGGGGIYYNLFDSHAPFQIDGNFGFTAGVTELLLQSYGGVIRLLPALPSHWASGSIKGLRAEGNFEIDQQWEEGKLTEATLKSFSGSDCMLKYPGISSADIRNATGERVEFSAIDANTISFPTAKGEAYSINPQGLTAVAAIAAETPAITVADNTVSLAGAEGMIQVYDTTGNLLASGYGQSLDIAHIAGGIIIVKAITVRGTATAKSIIR